MYKVFIYRSKSINYYCFALIYVPHELANYKLLKGIWLKDFVCLALTRSASHF